MALGLLTTESYSLDDAQRHRPPAQYVRAIIRHGIGCNIIDIANQLSFAYQGLASELRVFIPSPTSATNTSDFIRTLEENQEAWYDLIAACPPFCRTYSSQATGLLGSFYHPSQPRPAGAYSAARQTEKPTLSSQSETFYRYQRDQSPVSNLPDFYLS